MQVAVILLVSFLCRKQAVVQGARVTGVGWRVPVWTRVYPCGRVCTTCGCVCTRVDRVCARQHKKELRPPWGCRRRSRPHAPRSPLGGASTPALRQHPETSSACVPSSGDPGLAVGVSAAAGAPSPRASQGRALQSSGLFHLVRVGTGPCPPAAPRAGLRAIPRRTGAWQLPHLLLFLL